MYTPLKTIPKIMAIGLPAPVEAALRTALESTALLETETPTDTIYDMVLICAGKPANPLPGVPVLRQSFKTPQRLGTVLRRIRQILADPVLYLDDIALGTCLLQPQEKILRSDNGDVALTDKEVEILAYLICRHGTTVSRDDLLKDVWRYQPDVDTHTLETHIYRLRQKLSGIDILKNALSTDEDGGYRFVIP